MQNNSDLVLAALDEGDSAIAVLRPDAVNKPCIVDANKTQIRILGYPRHEMIGMSLWGLHAPGTCVTTQRSMDDAVYTGKVLRGEIELLSRDKRPIWFGFTMMPVVDPATNRLHSVMLGRDITAKRREEREHAMLQGLLASAFQKVEIAALIVSSDGRILLSNGTAHTLTGYRAAELHRTAIHGLMVPAHRQQITAEANCELDLTLICKDGRLMPVHWTSTIVRRTERQCFSLVMMRQIEPAEPAVPVEVAPRFGIGSIQFLGLDAVRAAYGDRWLTVRDRVLLAAEQILRRRLGEQDVFTRTPQDGFNIWFREGTEEENAACLARVGRQVRIVLLAELGDEANVDVSTFTDTTQLDTTVSQTSIMGSVSKQLEIRRKAAEQQARDLIAQIRDQRPRELSELYDNKGRSARAAFVDLPATQRGRFPAAMSLVGEAHSYIDVELFRISLAVDAILEDISAGKQSCHFVSVPFSLFLHRRGREQFLELWRTVAPAAQNRLVLMLTELGAGISESRIKEVADLLRPIMKAVGVELDDLASLPFHPHPGPFSIVGLMSDTLATLPHARITAFTAKMRQAKKTVLVRLAADEAPQRWHNLGADLTVIY